MPVPGMMPRSMNTLSSMAGRFGVPLHPSSVQPFVDMEKDRHRATMVRMFGAPFFGAASHIAPIVPEAVHGVAGAGTLPLTSAVPQMMGMANPAMDAAAGAAGGMAGTVMGHLAPVLAMSGVGLGAGVLGTYGLAKLMGSWMKRRQKKRMAQQSQGQLGWPKFSSILDPDLEEQGVEMFSDVRFVKFAAEGALGYSVPSNFVEAIEKVAFTAGFFSQVMGNHQLNDDEAGVLSNLVEATKMAQDLTTRLRNRLKVKTASAGYDYSLEAIARECFSGLLKKTASAKNGRNGLAGVIFDPASKTAAALSLLGLDEPVLRSISGGKQTAGYAAGLIGLVA